MKVILHLDLDSYFVSAHRLFDNSLIGKAVVISDGGRRSIISSASYEAKQKGIYVPMPLHKAKELLPSLIVVRPNFRLYTTQASKVFEFILQNYTSEIEVGSIDECYIDVTNLWKEYGSPKNLAMHMQKALLDKIGLPCSIGIADNKFTAKMSTQINKPSGITITRPGQFLKTFGSWDVARFHGIGKETAAKLNDGGYFKIIDLAFASQEDLQEIVGKRSSEIISLANGFGSNKVEVGYNQLKSIGHSTTFRTKDLTNADEILEVILAIIKSIAKRAEARNLVGKVIAVSLKVVGGKEVRAKSKQMTLTRHTSDSQVIFNHAKELFSKLWEGNTIKYVGVHLTNLTNIFDSTYQSSLFDNQSKKSKVELIISQINSQMRKKALITGREGAFSIRQKQKQSRYIESDRDVHFRPKK